MTVKKLWDFFAIGSALVGAVGTVIGIIFLAAVQWWNIQDAIAQVPALVAWKNHTDSEISRIAQEVHDMHENGVRVK